MLAFVRSELVFCSVFSFSSLSLLPAAKQENAVMTCCCTSRALCPTLQRDIIECMLAKARCTGTAIPKEVSELSRIPCEVCGERPWQLQCRGHCNRVICHGCVRRCHRCGRWMCWDCSLTCDCEDGVAATTNGAMWPPQLPHLTQRRACALQAQTFYRGVCKGDGRNSRPFAWPLAHRCKGVYRWN